MALSLSQAIGLAALPALPQILPLAQAVEAARIPTGYFQTLAQQMGNGLAGIGNTVVKAYQDNYKGIPWWNIPPMYDVPKPSAELQALFQEKGLEHNVPPKLLEAVAFTESGFDPRAVNHDSGSKGLFQFMPGTWTGNDSWNTDAIRQGDPFNARLATDAGARYLRWLADQFDGDWYRAVASYNQGIGYTRARTDPNTWTDETKKYVRRVFGRYGRNYGDAP